MAKKVVGTIELMLPAQQASPAPPVGPALGQHGLYVYNENPAGFLSPQEGGGCGEGILRSQEAEDWKDNAEAAGGDSKDQAQGYEHR